MFVIELMQEIWWKLKPKGVSGVSASRAVGNRAEAFALAFLRKHRRFKLIEQGMHDEDGELDLVGRMRGAEGLVVVEVRARARGGLVAPRDAVNITKQRQVVETAKRLLRRRGFHDVLRFDIVGVELDENGEPAQAEHYPDAFDKSVLR
ncbi:MAG: YraN family protein [Planctomycetes bacterium]|nr:YraN family protein [Planctomycetota bacterium]MCW8136461.1 YraN family protein [Planctomycetota bacterium]